MPEATTTIELLQAAYGIFNNFNIIIASMVSLYS